MPSKDRIGDENTLNKLNEVLAEIQQKNKKYKSAFLIRQDESLIPIKAEDFAYFTISSNIVKGVKFNKETAIIERKMKDLEEALNPFKFYRINRQFIIHRKAIKKIKRTIHGKLVLTVIPEFSGIILISKGKSKGFIKWMRSY